MHIVWYIVCFVLHVLYISSYIKLLYIHDLECLTCKTCKPAVGTQSVIQDNILVILLDIEGCPLCIVTCSLC
jgi:flavoprotein